MLQARLAPRGYYRAVGALRKRRCKAGNHECLRERLARRQVAALPVMRERPHQHGIGGPRRGRLALTINRHGRLTQRSHCCDPCSPRRCAATGAKHPLQSMVLWTRVVEPRGKRHPHHDRDASSCERSRRARRSPARARGPVRRRRAPATEASGGRRRITDANIDARGAGVGRRRRQVGATLVAADIGCVLPPRMSMAAASKGATTNSSRHNGKYRRAPGSLFAASVAPSWRVGWLISFTARTWSRVLRRPCRSRATATQIVGTVARPAERLATEPNDDV